jgi:hypothetical protein
MLRQTPIAFEPFSRFGRRMPERVARFGRLIWG